MTSSPSWFLVQAHGGRAQFAVEALAAPYRSCTSYLPLELVVVLHARRRTLCERPFFDRYLFVLNQGQGLRVINTTPGISHVVRNGNGVVLVSQAVIDLVKARETEAPRPNWRGTGRYVDLVAKFDPVQQNKYKPGETVRVNDGPFASFNAVFTEDKPEHRAKLLVQIFGRQAPVELEYGQFEKI